MTHDELLEELDEIIFDFEYKYDNSNPYYKALRAVVELHKPDWVLPTLTLPYEKPEPIAICSHCSYVADFRKIYPCPTIQAIEKELA